MGTNKDKDDEHYTEASVPTPPDQENVSAVDMVSGAVDQFLDDIQEDVGLQDQPKK